MEIDDGAPTAEDMQRVFDTSRSLQWNTVARKIAERTVSSGAEGGLDSLFSSLSKSGFLHVTLVLKKAKKMALGKARMYVVLRVALSRVNATWSRMATICKSFQIALLDQHALQHWRVIRTFKSWGIWREFRMSRSFVFFCLSSDFSRTIV